MEKNCFVCFTGIDGSGKTTLSNFLVNYLKEKNQKTIYAYGRLKPFVTLPIMYVGRKLLLNNTTKKHYSDYVKKNKEYSQKYRTLFSFYKGLLVLENIIQITLKVRVPMLLGYNVVCDRYIYDTIITDLGIYYNNQQQILDSIQKLYNYVPKPDIVFVLDVPDNVSLSRKDDIEHINYISNARKHYRKLHETYQFTYIDTSGLREEVENVITSTYDRHTTEDV